MYEVWLGVLIVWELAKAYWMWALPAAAVVGLLGAVVLLGRRPRGMRRVGAVGGGAVAVIAFFLLPLATSAQLSDMGYWVDWALLGGLALAAGAAGGIALAGAYALVAQARN